MPEEKTLDPRVDNSLSPHSASASPEAIETAQENLARIQAAVGGVAGQRSTDPKPTHAEALAQTIETLEQVSEEQPDAGVPITEPAEQPRFEPRRPSVAVADGDRGNE